MKFYPFVLLMLIFENKVNLSSNKLYKTIEYILSHKKQHETLVFHKHDLNTDLLKGLEDNYIHLIKCT